MILIIAKGNIIVNTGGKITANGANGGNGGSGVGFADTGSAVIAYGGGGGGGCGGGCVYLLHKGTHSNSGSITVNGGLGGTRGNYFKYGSTGSASVADPGQPGTNGTIFTKQLT
ncbi:hypothetical protein CBW65_04925 [Tumebacillus avium]|uniref:Uncharacterized protein n=1 Tax=Tumebacillus avium TaxID=1903704 RepID=A0A1Y0IK94_9BACL|nr:hypothetical protein CBW65_04925 [Tumebacillus avium]